MTGDGATQTIIRGTTFLCCDQRGDLTSVEHGLLAGDVRRLSTWRLTLDGALPEPVEQPRGAHDERTFIQRVPSHVARSSEGDGGRLSLHRRFVLGPHALHERLSLHNETRHARTVELRIDAAADGADLFAVKQLAFAAMAALSTSEPRVGPPPADSVGGVAGSTVVGGQMLVLAGGAGFCEVDATVPLDGDLLCWDIELDPGETWTCDLRIRWSPLEEGTDGALSPSVFDAQAHASEQRRNDWRMSMPAFACGEQDMSQLWDVSIGDLGALQVEAGIGRDAMLTAAGAPWFMAVFGRDSLITCIQTMVLGASRARGALRYLADRQATSDDAAHDAEPGKILHEIREGTLADRGYDCYYGSIDSTPLFLMALSEYHRWTGDDAFVRELWPNALAALAWVRSHGDLDGDGYLEYMRRAPGGLGNQSWKDSWDSQRHRDGSIAVGPIAPAEVQGYAYAARLGCAELAATVMDEQALGEQLAAEAQLLKARFNSDFWVEPEMLDDPPVAPGDPRAHGFFALALDAAKRPLATLASNVGHLLWSGIVDEQRAPMAIAQLLDPVLFSGWGLRTVAADEAAFDPLSYHCGTVWPHDTAIAVAGLARYGAHDAAAQVARGLVDAARESGGRLPEVFSGSPRSGDEPPTPYPTSSSPQSWAAGSAAMIVTALLGLSPDPATGSLAAAAGATLPGWLDGVRIAGVEVCGTTHDISVIDGRVVCEPGATPLR